MQQGKIVSILSDHWNDYVGLYKEKIRVNVKIEVEKVLRCRDINYGYIELKCKKCNELKRIGFSCKSRFCKSCGKIYVDNWINKLMEKLINVRHRHMVFTIPEELREIFERNRKLLGLLPQCAAQTIMSWMKEQNKSEEYTPGIVAVIHTFGRDLKWNPHVHMIVTEGGTGKKNPWQHIKFFPYKMLRIRWKQYLLEALSKNCKEKRKMKDLRNKLYIKADKGFYVYAKSEIKTIKQSATYIGRYVGRPVIAESRILGYDGEYVTYEYVRHEDNKKIVEMLHVYDFIEKITKHIPEKYFNMIRYFGIYSNKNSNQNNFIKMFDEKILKMKKSLGKWQYRILAAFGVDPCKCPKCGEKMIFNDIVYPKYGSIRERMKRKILNHSSMKLEEIMESYAAVKGILCGTIKPTTR